MPREQDLPPPLRALARRQAVAITDARFHEDVDNVIACIEKAIPMTLRPAAVAGKPRQGIPISPIAAILVLSLATWSYFYAMSMPLDPAGTVVVVGVWISVVLFIRWIWTTLSRPRTRAGGQE
jgi:hypothetical protein